MPAVRDELDVEDGDDTGNYNAFWAERDYISGTSTRCTPASSSRTGSTTSTCKPTTSPSGGTGCAAAQRAPQDVDRAYQGHVDPFDGRRDVWVDTLHRWFDYWLQGVQNGIMNEPAVDIEESKDVWNSYTDWPIPGTQMTNVFLQGTSATAQGALGGSTGGATDTLTFRDANLSENNMLSLTNTQANKRTFISAPLKAPLRISGTPIVELEASLSKTQSNLTALIVDYGPSTQTTRSGDGIGQTNPEVRTCWGESVPDDTPCFRETTKPTQTVTQWRVTKGMMDSSNRLSLRVAEPVTIGEKYRFTWPTLPEDFTFAAGHRIGIVIGANFSAYGSTNGMTQTDVTVDTKLSKVSLPIVGGYDAAVAAGAFSAETVAPEIGPVSDITVDTPTNTAVVTYPTPTVSDNEDPTPEISCSPASGSAFTIGQTIVTCTARDAQGNTATKSFTVTVRGTRPVGGTVPATLSLTLGAPANFGAFTPGVDEGVHRHEHRQRHQHGGRRDAQRLRARQPDQRHVLAARAAARGADARQLDRAGLQRRGGDHVPPAHRRERPAAHGHLLEDADLHAQHDHAVSRGGEPAASGGRLPVEQVGGQDVWMRCARIGDSSLSR